MTPASAPESGDEPATSAGGRFRGRRPKPAEAIIFTLAFLTAAAGFPLQGLAEPQDPEPAAPPRVETAAVPTPEPEPEPEPPPPSPAEVAIEAAREQLGTPYRWAGTGPNGFDCSGLTLFAYRQAGIELPRDSRSQYAALPRVALDEIVPGDLVFSGRGRVGHVGIYIGDGMMIHSPQSGRRVEVAPLRRNLIGAGRPWT